MWLRAPAGGPRGGGVRARLGGRADAYCGRRRVRAGPRRQLPHPALDCAWLSHAARQGGHGPVGADPAVHRVAQRAPQRFGRGLMRDPRIMLLDEPSLGLAPLLVEQVFRTIREHQLRAGRADPARGAERAQGSLHRPARVHSGGREPGHGGAGGGAPARRSGTPGVFGGRGHRPIRTGISVASHLVCDEHR